MQVSSRKRGHGRDQIHFELIDHRLESRELTENNGPVSSSFCGAVDNGQVEEFA